MLTSEVPIAEIFTGDDPVKMDGNNDGHNQMDHGMRSLMDDLGLSMDMLLESSIFVSLLNPRLFPHLRTIPPFSYSAFLIRSALIPLSGGF